MQKSVFQTQFSPSKLNWIFLKMIFLFQYVIGRITFVKNFFPLLQNWKSLFTKNVPEIVWLRRSSKCKILKNHLNTKYFWVNTYLLLNVVLKIQYLWTPYSRGGFCTQAIQHKPKELEKLWRTIGQTDVLVELSTL